MAIIDPYTQLRGTGALDANPVNYTPLQSFLDASKYTDAYSKAHDVGSKMGSIYSWAGAGEGTYGKQGLSSDVRHTLGSSAGKDAIIDWASTNLGIDPHGKFANVIGNVGITGATALEEIPDAWRAFTGALEEKDYNAITSGGIFAQPWEDVQANLNAWGIPYGTTLRQKMSHVPLLNKLRKQEQQADVFKKIKEKQLLADAAADARKKQRMSDKQYDDWRRHNDAGYGKTADEKLAMTGGTEEWGEDMMGGTEAPGNGNVSAETGTDFGPNSAMIARGGLAQHAPRYANGGLIDFFRYGGFIGQNSTIINTTT